MMAANCPVHGVVITLCGTGCPICVDIAEAAERDGRSPAVAMMKEALDERDRKARPWPSPRVSSSDPFVDMVRTLAPELAVLLRSVAYGATLMIEAGETGHYAATIQVGPELLGSADRQLTKALSDLARRVVGHLERQGT